MFFDIFVDFIIFIHFHYMTMHRLQTYKAHTNAINNLYWNIRIQSEQDLKKKIDDKADWTNNQAQSEMKGIQLHQDIVDDKNRQL
jgi:hypothetical protein